MPFHARKSVFCGPRAAIAAVLLISAGAAGASEVAAPGLFSGLAGSWRGEGSIGWTTGETEHIRCNATYTVDAEGNKLSQRLTCATDSTRLVIASDIRYTPAAGAITGSWQETSYGINGKVTGSANSARIQAQVQSTDRRFTAKVTVVTHGDDQTVTIDPQGIDVTTVNVQLRRSS